MPRRTARALRFVPLVILVLAATGRAGEAPAGTVVLDTSGFWRYHYTLKAPVIRTGGGTKALDAFVDTPPPPNGWQQPGFDDSAWRRLPGPSFPAVGSTWSVVAHRDPGFANIDSGSPCLALVCARGRFKVTDPARVKSLALSLAYRGGAVVYLNGREIARGHLPKKGGLEEIAEHYPDEAFIKADGSLLDADRGEKDKENLRRWDLRTRRLEDIEIPAGALRRGVNALAVEVHRSPYCAKIPELVKKLRDSRSVPKLIWCTCDLVSVRLSAPAAAGLEPNVVRPKGMQVWNSDVLSPDFDLDFGDPNEALRPVRIVGTPNGAFSGKVVVGSTGPIKGLSARASDLAAKNGGRIGSSAVQIRYPLPDSSEKESAGRYPAEVTRFDGLAGKAPPEIPVRVKKKGRGNWVRKGQPSPVMGAVQPVWITVRVPPDAKAGEYTGTLTIASACAAAVKVPVALKVCGYRLPEPHRRHMWAEFVQSPDALAVEYKVPLWSDDHWGLIEKSLSMLAEAGDKSVYVPLIAETNMGNAESMVRWIKRPGGDYRHDFTVMDKYLDLVQKHYKEPAVVCLYVWDIFLTGAMKNTYAQKKEAVSARAKYAGKGPEVTLLDPATGKTSKVFLPRYDEPAARNLWRPVMKGIRERIARRGWGKSLMLGMVSDSKPRKEEVALFTELLPGVPWIMHCHSPWRDLHGQRIAYKGGVWSTRYSTAPEDPLRYGWKKQAFVHVQFRRGNWDSTSAVGFRTLGEINIMGTQRGFGRMGAEFWKVFRDKRGRRHHCVGERYYKAEWRNLNILTSMLAPGSEGPVSTTRFEMMREGLQECEARILVERAVTDKTRRAKLGEALAKRCEKVLAERSLAMQIANNSLQSLGFKERDGWNKRSYTSQVTYQWYIVSGWQERSEALFEAAAEVAGRLGEK